MAITSKVNMVLHGDGSAHIYKHDAFKPLSSFEADKFHDAGEHRSVPRTRYDYDVCESFDLVVSNPPFGINLAAETKSKVSNTYSLKSTSNSESLFLERCHQLLKPGGRLAVVLPESLLNTTDSANVRLLLYRFFNIKSIVALPRNVFIDTPTLTSLLFAQKKTEEEVDEWDTAWQSAKNNVDQKVSQAKNNLRSLDDSATTSDVQRVFLDALSPVVDASSWIRKGGANPEIMSVDLPSDIDSVDDAVDYYERFLGYAGFDDIKRNYIFESVASELNYDFQVFQVDEVGYKLSRRSEQTRPNQLCNFVSQESNSEVPNLHLTNDSVSVEVDDSNPRTILDYIASRVEWN
jgi:type I restriction enzyme M protein